MRAGPGLHLERAAVSVLVGEDERQTCAAHASPRPSTSRNSDEWVTGSKTIANPFGRVSDIAAFSPGASSMTSRVMLLNGAFDVLRHVGARAPEDLAHVFGERQRIGIMRGDAPNPRD